jgi:hypothetical protein
MLMDTLPDAAHLVPGALTLSQFLGDRPYSGQRIALGIAVWVAQLGWACLPGKENARG